MYISIFKCDRYYNIVLQFALFIDLGFFVNKLCSFDRSGKISEVHPDDPINEIPTIQTEFRQLIEWSIPTYTKQLSKNSV